MWDNITAEQIFNTFLLGVELGKAYQEIQMNESITILLSELNYINALTQITDSELAIVHVQLDNANLFDTQLTKIDNYQAMSGYFQVLKTLQFLTTLIFCLFVILILILIFLLIKNKRNKYAWQNLKFSIN